MNVAEKLKEKLHTISIKSHDSDERSLAPSTNEVRKPALSPAEQVVEETRAQDYAKEQEDDAASLASVGTTYTQAETKRLNKWRSYFPPEITDDDDLFLYTKCALSDSILIQGRFYVSGRNITFASNLPGLKRRVIIPIVSLTAVRKHSVLLIPTAIELEADGQSYLFASIMGRDHVHSLIMSRWKENNRETYDAFLAEEPEQSDETKGIPEVDSPSSGGPRKTTQAGTAPLKELCLDIRLPTTPEKAFELIWRNEEFIKKFWEESQHLKEVDLGPWEGDKLKKRKYSYVKPLSNRMGPKETKCILEDEDLNLDKENYFETMTITKTPDVPSGDKFEIHTKTSLSWAGGSKGGCKVLVTTEVKWSGSSMLKSTITSASVDGQKQYHRDLAKAIRAHIKEHAAEFKTSDTVAPDADDEFEEDVPAEPKEGLASKMLNSLLDAPSNPAMLLLISLVLLLLISNIVTSVSLHKTRLPAPQLPANAIARVERLERIVEDLRKALN